MQNNYSAAVKESTKALELNPNYLKALMRRAQANENLEKFEEALSGMQYEVLVPVYNVFEYLFSMIFEVVIKRMSIINR